MKTLLQAARPILADLAATLCFVAVAAVTHNPLLATALAMLIAVGQMAWARARRRAIGALQWMGLGLVVVLGAAALLTHDLRFMMFKPTAVYALIGAVMLRRGWLLPYMPERARGLVGERAIVGWGYAWAVLMLASAALNLYFALFAGFAAWSRFVAVFPLASKLGLFAVQYLAMRGQAVRRHRALRLEAAA